MRIKGRVRQLRIRADRADHADASQLVRHHGVEQEEIGRGGMHEGQPFNRIVGFVHLIPVRLEDDVDELTKVRVVIDDDNVSGHGQLR